MKSACPDTLPYPEIQLYNAVKYTAGGENMQQMVSCPNCGSQNAASQQFCVSCGANLGNPQRPVSHVPIVTGVAMPPPLTQPMVTPAQLITPVAASALDQARQVEVKPTWSLAWGLFWRMCFLWMFIAGIVFLVYMLVRLALGYTTVF
jgi:hypothetical protein